MNALELYNLGRKLMKLGEEALPPSGFQRLPTSVRSILVDVFAHPGSSISDITARTGFPQSHVSASVARLREHGALMTETDPADRRRTLVSPARDALSRGLRHASGSIDSTIAEVMGCEDGAEIAAVVAALELAAEKLTPKALARIRSAQGELPEVGALP